MPSFDLRDQPWIPVRYLPGTAGDPEAGLDALLARAHEIADIALPLPPAASGLWRVLYLIAARVTGLDFASAGDPAGWRRARDRVLAGGRFDPAAASRYLGAHAGGLDLFHPQRPWLQDARLAAECAKGSGVGKLVLGRASGNNLTLLSHDADRSPRPVPASRAAWNLLAWLYYGPSGQATPRTVAGRTESNMTAGPLRSRISFHPLGATVFESLVLGIPYPGRYQGGSPAAAPWEHAAATSPLGAPPVPAGLAGPLTGRFRHALLLEPSPDGALVTGARITWAWREPHPPAEDPYLIYDTPARGGKPVPGAAPYARYARAARPPWRDLDALMDDTETSRRPAVFSDLPGEAVTGPLRVRAWGFEQDGQTVDRQWFTAVTPPVPAARAAQLTAARQAASTVAGDLRKALRQAWAQATGAGDPDGPWTQPCLDRYWAAAEAVFWQAAQPGPQAPGDPHRALIQLALTAWEDTTGQYALRGPRAVRALEQARGGVAAAWNASTNRQEAPVA